MLFVLSALVGCFQSTPLPTTPSTPNDLLLGDVLSGDGLSGEVFKISGFSMAPTLRGRSQVMQCQRCGDRGTYAAKETYDVHLRKTDQAAKRLQCPSCGGQLHWLNLESIADQVRLDLGSDSGSNAGDDMSLNSFTRGDVVAIQRGSNPDMIKRIVGLPGDRISTDGLEIRINDRPVIDAMHFDDVALPPKTVLVHRQSTRDQSTRDQTTRDQTTLDQARWSKIGDWNVYEHQNVYRGGRPSPIMDDYATNRWLSRKMYPAKGALTLSGRCRNVQRIDFLFFVDGKTEIGSFELTSNSKTNASGTDRFSFDSTQSVVDHEPSSDDTIARPVDASHPIAFRCTPEDSVASDLEISHLELGHLEIRRSIHYRLRPHDDATIYPLRLKADQYFVLGDNVPISVDSRDFGPVLRKQIMGKVVRAEMGFSHATR